ncbi:MAG TPA: hypothetical protein VFO96_05390 [Gemmatimonadales bacterium]|nr:hypothetical protein [Gemmatimonadales bacterium]
MSRTAAGHRRTGNPWKSRFVRASLLTDPRYVLWRLRRRLARGRGQPVPMPGPTMHPRVRARASDELAQLDVDLVYTWVHGQDPSHRELRNTWARRYGLDPVVFNPDVRYVEHDELRYSLRSVERFAPWVRKIYIVTPGQTPGWLNASHPRITVVHQDSIMADPAWAPVFNSLAIEAQLHRIPGLAEHFIYCNDDMFLGQRCHKSDFFAVLRGSRARRVGMKVMLSERDDDWIVPWQSVSHDRLARLWMAQWNNVKFALELRRPWRKVRKLTNHQAQSMTRSALRHASERLRRDWERTCTSKFRGPDDLEFLAVARYLSLANGSAVRGFLPHEVFASERALIAHDRPSLPALFCVNDGAGEADEHHVRELERLFPEPSTFERTRPAQGLATAAR